MPRKASDSHLFEQLRSFVTLARWLNVTRACAELGCTRQTLKNHIKSLENSKNGSFFSLVNRKKQLTPLGTQQLIGAKQILALSNQWLNKKLKIADQLLEIKISDPSGFLFHSKQLHLSKIWEPFNEILQHYMAAYYKSHGKINDPAFSLIDVHCALVRRINSEFIYFKIGEKNLLSQKMGGEWAYENVGKPIFSNPMDVESIEALTIPYSNVFQQGGHYLDHVTTEIPLGGGLKSCFSYKRLLLGMTLPDSSPCVASFFQETIKTNDLLNIN